jgi:hypothetical protein
MDHNCSAGVSRIRVWAKDIGAHMLVSAIEVHSPGSRINLVNLWAVMTNWFLLIRCKIDPAQMYVTMITASRTEVQLARYNIHSFITFYSPWGPHRP